MSSIVIALPKIEDARKIRGVLECHGLAVASVCSTASNALSSASELGNGVLICGHRLPDMNYHTGGKGQNHKVCCRRVPVARLLCSRNKGKKERYRLFLHRIFHST